ALALRRAIPLITDARNALVEQGSFRIFASTRSSSLGSSLAAIETAGRQQSAAVIHRINLRIIVPLRAEHLALRGFYAAVATSREGHRHVQILNAVKTSQVGLGLLNACAKVFKEKVGGANIQHKWYRHASRQKALVTELNFDTQPVRPLLKCLFTSRVPPFDAHRP